MHGKRAPSERAPRGGGEQADAHGARRPDAAEAARDERYGPLTIARLRKDDGRALLSFARAPEGERRTGTGAG